MRTNRLAPAATLSPALKFHSLRHTYASLCVAAGIKPEKLSRRMGHANPTTTEHIYTHVYKKADHSDEMGKLGAMSRTAIARQGNVIPLRG